MLPSVKAVWEGSVKLCCPGCTCRSCTDFQGFGGEEAGLHHGNNEGSFGHNNYLAILSCRRGADGVLAVFFMENTHDVFCTRSMTLVGISTGRYGMPNPLPALENKVLGQTD